VHHSEPISPELVLVDPELAQVARALLPPPPTSVSTPRVVAQVDSRTSGSSKKGRVPMSTVIVVMTLVAAAFGLTLISELWNPASQRPTLAVETRLHEVVVRPSAEIGALLQVSAAQQARAPHVSSTLETKPDSPRVSTEVETTASLRKASKPIEANTIVAPVSTKVGAVLRWNPTSDASYYNVVVWRDGKRVLDLWPRQPQVELPHAWTYCGKSYRLEPGRYLWFVFPYRGPRGHGRFVGLTEHGVLLEPASVRSKRG
jgi:hypothetical protein